MAVGFVSQTGYQQTTNAASHTISSYVVSSGTLVGLVVTVALEVNSRTVSGITWNTSQSFSLKSTHTYTPSSGPDFRIEIWYLASPTATTANIVISLAGGTATFSGGVTQVTGMGTSAVGTAVTSGAATANPSVTVTDFAVGDYLIDILQESVGVATAGTNQVGDYDNTGLSFYFTHGSHQNPSDGGVMSWTQGAGERHLVAFAIKQNTAVEIDADAGSYLVAGQHVTLRSSGITRLIHKV